MQWASRLRSFAVLAVPVAAAGLLSAQATERTTLSGRVVAAATGRPIPNAQVAPQLLPASDGVISARTDAEGRFEFQNLRPDRYTLRAFATGYVSSIAGDEAGLGPRPIVLRAGSSVAGIEFQLHRGATIAGRVVDERKEPVVATTVAAFERRWNQGELQFARVTSVPTDDRGQYRLIGLAPGEYVVGAINKASLTFAPASTTLKGATRLNVKVDEERPGVDIQARQAPTGSIEGALAGAGGAAVQLVADVSEVPVPTQSATQRPDGHFAFEDVVAGSYLLIVRPGPTPGGRGSGATMWARQPVVVRANETTTASLALQPAGRIGGVAEGLGRARDVSLAPIGSAHPEANTARSSLGNDGSFTLSVAPGRYRWLRTQESIFVLSLFQKDLDIADLPLEVTPGLVLDGLRMVETRPSKIVGRVVDRDGNATAKGGVLVAPTDRRYWTGVSRRLTIVRADASGDFVAPRMPPGEYFVAHINAIAPGQLWDAAFLRGLPQTTRVTVVSGQDATVELRVK